MDKPTLVDLRTGNKFQLGWATTASKITDDGNQIHLHFEYGYELIIDKIEIEKSIEWAYDRTDIADNIRDNTIPLYIRNRESSGALTIGKKSHEVRE